MRYAALWSVALAGLILLTVPWFFIPFERLPDLLSLPAWIVYSLAAMALYAAAASIAITTLWDRIARGGAQ